MTLSGDIPLCSLRGLQNALPQIQVLGVRPGGEAADFVNGSPTDVDLYTGDQVVVMGRREVLRTLLPSLQRGSQDSGIAATT